MANQAAREAVAKATEENAFVEQEREYAEKLEALAKAQQAEGDAVAKVHEAYGFTDERTATKVLQAEREAAAIAKEKAAAQKAHAVAKEQQVERVITEMQSFLNSVP